MMMLAIAKVYSEKLVQHGSHNLPGSIQNTKHLWGIAIKRHQTECNYALKYC